MGTSAIGTINLGVPAYQLNFTNADLSSGILTVTHNLNSQYVSVTVYNNSDLIIIPDDVTATSTTVSTIDLTSYGTLTGTWRAIVLDKGATNAFDGTATNLNISGQTTGDRIYYNGSAWVRVPACMFLVEADGTQTNIATATPVSVQWATEVFDVGGNFASNAFTAPVTGYYQFNLSLVVREIDSASSEYTVNLDINGTSARNYYGLQSFEGTNDRTWWYFSLSHTVHMTASDTAAITINQGSGTSQSDINSSSKFSGHLIVPA